MVAKIDPPELKPDRVRQLLSEWFATKHAATVAFSEEINPTPDDDARYEVAYEAIFEPSRLDQARVEIWVTTGGEVAIGFERLKRIAERLGVRSESDRFAAGHEPHSMSETGLFMILDLISAGKISILPNVVPFFGLISTKAVVPQTAIDLLASNGYSPVNWLKGISQTDFSEEGRFVQFHRWS